MRIFCFFFLVINLQYALISQNDLFFFGDKDASSIVNAENLISTHRILYEFENEHLKQKYWDENNWKGKALGVGYRFTKTVLFDFQIDFLTHLIQHEAFGHGFRFREFGFEDNSFNLNPLPPYGSGGGFAQWGTPSKNRSLGIHENIVIRSGGMEAAAVLSKSLRNKWIDRGDINYRESLLYLSAFHDYSAYIFSTKWFDRQNPGNDVNNYLRFVNSSYGLNNEDTYQLTLDKLAKNTAVNSLNTFHFFAIYTYLKVYLFDGEESFSYPMIKLGKMKWLPAIRFGLTPFGGEFIFENFLKTDRETASIELKIGDNILDKSWGAGLNYQRNFSENVQLSSIANIWSQPSMELGGISVSRTKKGLGGRFLGEVNLKLNNTFPIGIFGQIGYKTTGFIEGERLDKGTIFRLGVSIRTTQNAPIPIPEN